MRLPFVYLRTLSCANTIRRASSAGRGIMSGRQSVFPSTIYPKLESVDLGEETPKQDAPVSDLDFEDHSESFRAKTTWEIVRALTVLKMCSVNKLVDNSLVTMRRFERVCGKHFFRVMFKPILYKQFVGGENMKEVQQCLRKLTETGVRSILAATMEEDVGEGGDENVYDNNCQRILESIEIAATESIPSPMIQLKLSGLLQAELLVEIGYLYSSCSEKLKLIETIVQGIQNDDFNATVLDHSLTVQKQQSLKKALKRLKDIGKEASCQGVKVLVDAEYTYLNPGLSLLTLAAIQVFNRDVPIFFNTYQCYLKDAQSKIDEESTIILKDMNCCFGGKLVRGAYMVQERDRAQKLNTEDPVCEDYSSTSKNYHKILLQLLDMTSTYGSRCQFIIASHNEESVKIAIKRMAELNIDKQKGGVSFGQLYGMCDQVTSPLANANYAVYKSIPFGTVNEVLPYIARRAIENKSVIEGARKERLLLNRELKRRMKQKLPFRSTNDSIGST